MRVVLQDTEIEILEVHPDSFVQRLDTCKYTHIHKKHWHTKHIYTRLCTYAYTHVPSYARALTQTHAHTYPFTISHHTTHTQCYMYTCTPKPMCFYTHLTVYIYTQVQKCQHKHTSKCNAYHYILSHPIKGPETWGAAGASAPTQPLGGVQILILHS